jgi:hypothetical protein
MSAYRWRLGKKGNYATARRVAHALAGMAVHRTLTTECRFRTLNGAWDVRFSLEAGFDLAPECSLSAQGGHHGNRFLTKIKRLRQPM